jgi:hypothetical protein
MIAAQHVHNLLTLVGPTHSSRSHQCEWLCMKSFPLSNGISINLQIDLTSISFTIYSLIGGRITVNFNLKVPELAYKYKACVFHRSVRHSVSIIQKLLLIVLLFSSSCFRSFDMLEQRSLEVTLKYFIFHCIFV